MPKLPERSAATGASAQVTAAEVSRLAGVTRATVSNWRRRHADFPSPVGGTDSSPLYDLTEVRTWLAGRRHGRAVSPVEELRTLLRLNPDDGSVAARLLPLVLAERRARDRFVTADSIPDGDLAARAQSAVHALPTSSDSHFADVTYGAQDGPLLHAVLRCIDEGQSQDVVDVLAERELEDEAVSGVYTTPGWLADLMARLLGAAGPGSEYQRRVFDPACGSGALLAAAAREGARHLFGQDVVPIQVRRSMVSLALNSPDTSVEIRADDSLRADAFAELTADGLLCNPPYGDRDWGHDELVYDPRWAYGVPPRGDSELAWVQHALAHISPGAFAVVLLPPAVASRSQSRRGRAELIRAGALRAVVALPPGAAPPLHIGLHIWILQRPERTAPEHQSTLCVDASALTGSAATPPSHPGQTSAGGRTQRREAVTGSTWNALSDGVLHHWAAYVRDPAGFADIPGQARAVPIVDLLDGLVDVTPARNIRTSTAAADPVAIAKQIGRLRRELAEAAEALAIAAEQGEWAVAGPQAREWRTATLADLTRGGALTLHRAGPSPPRERETPTPAEFADRPVLTARDVATGQHATSGSETPLPHTTTIVTEGDVLLAEIRGESGAGARVADTRDSGAVIGRRVHLIRPDPTRLDAWFLAGFLAAEDNLNSASTGISSLRIDPTRLRVPLLPLEEQRRYGEAFRHLHNLRQAASRSAELATLAPKALADGLTSGTLLPPPDNKDSTNPA